MIKLTDILKEITFQSDEPSSFSNEQEVIQDYINDLPSEGTTMTDVMEDVANYPHAFQLRLLMRIAKDGLLNLSNSNIKVKPEGVLKMFDAQSDIAYNALANFNLNENEVDYYEDRNGNKFQTVDVNYLQYPGRVMVKYDDVDESVEYKGNLEADLKTGMVKRLNSEIDEAFFIGEDRTIECGKCGWRWKFKDGGEHPYLCKCKYDNSYKYNGGIDEAFFIGEDEPAYPGEEEDVTDVFPTGTSDWNKKPMEEDQIDEYDVDENDLEEVKDFIKFIKEYKTFLNEAQCDCVMEAEYHGRKVQLGKPMQGDIKKFKVYVKNNKGKVVKVNFGFGGKSAKGKRMVIKAKNPKRRSAYRKRHHCDNPGPRWKANYWSCRKW